MPVVGFLNPTSSKLYDFNAAAFRKGLQDEGFVANVRIEYRWGEIGTKRIEVLHQLAPRSKVALLMNPNNPSAAMEQHDAEAAAMILGQKSIVLNVASKDDFPAAFETFIREGADAIFVATDPMLLSQRNEIVAFAARQRVPAIHFERQYPLAGGLISYGTSISGMYRQAGVYCGQILKGAKPAEMPVLQPTKFELVINLKTAKELGIEVSSNLLAPSPTR
jgi:putative tryptophan/tyrosine transport system substrate-binding protein